MNLVDVDPGDPRLVAEVLPVLQELRPHLTPATLAAVYAEAHPQGLRFLAVYDADRCVGVAGWRVIVTTTAIKKLYVDDLVVAAAARSQGIGRRLLSELVDRGRRANCRILDLDSGVQRGDAHRFYTREGMTIASFHFVRRLD